jgi:hypothetical protein
MRKYTLLPFWFPFLDSYLTNRTFQVKVGSTLSKSSAVTSGVPQGSVLGPTLFIAFFNIVSSIPLNPRSNIILYADDVVLTHPMDSEQSLNIIQSDVNKLCECVKSLGLSLNESKCQFMVIQLTTRNNHQEPIAIHVNGTELLQTSSYKYLGVITDNQLTFRQHATHASMKTKQAIGVLNRTLRKWAPTEVMKTAVTSLALPILCYAIEVWYPPAICTKRHVERVQKFAARLLNNDFRQSTKYEDLLSPLKWRPLYRQVAERRLTTMKKYLCGVRFISPDVFNFNCGPSQNRQSTRIKEKRGGHNLTLASSSAKESCREENLAASQMRKLWNCLPETVVNEALEGFIASTKSENTFQYLCERLTITVPDV